MLCGSGYFLAGWVKRGPPARVAQGGLTGIDYRMSELVPITLFKCPRVAPCLLGYPWGPVGRDCRVTHRDGFRYALLLYICGNASHVHWQQMRRRLNPTSNGGAPTTADARFKAQKRNGRQRPTANGRARLTVDSRSDFRSF
ncbi:hypothetical protein M9H77_07875 [Catharanthus roseus]|uniref:Uncharacterized protein n=1 Tax=Catharanthus roseus TaxID=4058 RepID=A0ACC0BW62_CATRO|nr:hypothetical protein M9H77_07875 [Catharanthus roseus]